MKQFKVLLMALLLIFFVTNGAYANKFSVTGFTIDNQGEMSFKAFNEAMSTNDTVTAAETGKVFYVYSTANLPTRLTLPAAAAGLTYTAIDGNGNKFILAPNGTDNFAYTTANATDQLLSAGAVGNAVSVYASDDTVWHVNSNGTLTILNY